MNFIKYKINFTTFVVSVFIQVALFLNSAFSQNSYIVKLKEQNQEPNLLKVLSRLQGNKNIAKYKPIFKFSENNLQKIAEDNPQKNELKKYYVLEFSGSGQEKNISQIKDLDFVETVFKNHVYRIENFNDSAYKSQWALQKIEAESGWEITTGDSNVIVGFIDTGVDIFHNDLRQNLRVNVAEDINHNNKFEPWSSKEKRNNLFGDLDGIDQDGDGFADNVLGYDFIDQTTVNLGDTKSRDADPSDENGHGTNIAGIIAATRGNGIGISGVAPNVSILPLRAFDATGNGEDDDISAAIVYAAEHKVSVLNMSFGDFYYSPLMLDAINYAVSKGVICCAASGNSGGIKNHYPSSYANVISVGMSADEDYVHPFSTGSSNLCIAAPGVDIATTSLNNSYKNVTGTSAATPHVAAVCALLRSLHKNWKPIEIRSVLELSADDISKVGWDEYSGSGRLNMRRALFYNSPAVLELASPQSGSSVGLDTLMNIWGTIESPLFKSWELYWGYGFSPNSWDEISRSDKMISNREISNFKLTALNDTVITVRLVLRQSDGRSSERRSVLYVESSKTKITDLKVEKAISNDAAALAITARTNSLSRMFFYFKPKNSNLNFKIIEHESERISGLQRNHFILITNQDFIPEVEYSAYYVFLNTKGDTVMLGSELNPITLKLDDINFPTTNFSRKKYSLPYGFLFEDVSNSYYQNISSVLMNQFDGGNFSKLAVYNFEKDSFKIKDSTGNWVPRAISKLGGKNIILAQALNKGIIYSQEQINSNPFEKIIFTDTSSRNFTPSTFYDFDNDGIDEIIAYSTDTNGVSFGIYKISNTNSNPLQISKIAALQDFTKPAKDQKYNMLSTPDVVISDFNHNGKTDVLMSDEDGDFFMYEMQSMNNFTPIWSKEFEAISGGSLISKIDFDGDKNYDFVIGNRLSPNENSDGEYEPSLWEIQVLQLDANNKEQIIYQTKIAQVRSTLPFRSGLIAKDLDGDKKDELIISTAPNFYILKYSSQEKSFKPLWYKSSAMVNKPLVFDFDNDGYNEVSVGNGGEFYFYQIKTNDVLAPVCAGFKAFSLNENKVKCSWEKQSDAISYKVFKAEYDFENPPTNFLLVAETEANEIIDSTDLQNNKYYLYFVIAVYSNNESNPSNTALVYTHTPIKILSAERLPYYKIKLNLSNFIKDELYRSGVVSLVGEQSRGQYQVSSVINLSEKSLIVTYLPNRFSDSILTIRLTDIFRDYYNSPPSNDTFNLAIDNRLIVVGSCLQPLKISQIAPNKISIVFNFVLNKQACEKIENYALAPELGIINIASDSDSVVITTANSIRPNGRNYFITMKNLLSDKNAKQCDSVAVLGFALQQSGLDSVFAYPQPFLISRDEKMFFGGLTFGAKIEIYTKGGALIKTLLEKEGNGGVEWYGDNEQGSMVPSGIYLYRVLNIGNDLEEINNSGWKKIVVVN